MKKTRLKAFLCLLSAAAILLSAAACKSSPDATSSDSSTGVDFSDSQPEESSNVSETPSETSSDSSNSSTASSSSKPSAQSEKTTNLTRDQVMAQMPDELRNTTIKYMTWNSPKKEMEKDAIAEFEEKTGIKIEVEMVDLNEKYNILASRIAAGNSPDLFRTDESWPSVCKNLQPIENLNFNFNDKAWDWDIMHDFTFNGKTYSMQLADTPFTPVAVLYYDKSAIKKAEMEDPYTIWKKNPDDWTWDKFFELCKTFLDRNGNKDGYYGAIFGNTYIYAYTRAFGLANVSYDYKTSTYTSNLQNPEYIKRMEILADAIQKKYISSTAQGFEMGQVLFAWDWSQNAQANNVYYGNLKKRNNLGIVPIPTDSTKQVLYQHIGHGVPVGAKNPEAVPYFIRYIQDRKGYNIDTIYSVPNSAEVVEWTLEQGRKNKNFYVGDSIHNYTYITKIMSSPASQVKAICDTHAPEFEAAVKDLNNVIASMPK